MAEVNPFAPLVIYKGEIRDAAPARAWLAAPAPAPKVYPVFIILTGIECLVVHSWYDDGAPRERFACTKRSLPLSKKLEGTKRLDVTVQRLASEFEVPLAGLHQTISSRNLARELSAPATAIKCGQQFMHGSCGWDRKNPVLAVAVPGGGAGNKALLVPLEKVAAIAARGGATGSAADKQLVAALSAHAASPAANEADTVLAADGFKCVAVLPPSAAVTLPMWHPDTAGVTPVIAQTLFPAVHPLRLHAALKSIRVYVPDSTVRGSKAGGEGMVDHEGDEGEGADDEANCGANDATGVVGTLLVIPRRLPAAAGAGVAAAAVTAAGPTLTITGAETELATVQLDAPAAAPVPANPAQPALFKEEKRLSLKEIRAKLEAEKQAATAPRQLPVLPPAGKQSLKGQVVAITGILPEMARAVFSIWLVNRGATYSTKVDQKTTILLKGEAPNAEKLEAATKLGAKVVVLDLLEFHARFGLLDAYARVIGIPASEVPAPATAASTGSSSGGAGGAANDGADEQSSSSASKLALQWAAVRTSGSNTAPLTMKLCPGGASSVLVFEYSLALNVATPKPEAKPRSSRYHNTDTTTGVLPLGASPLVDAAALSMLSSLESGVIEQLQSEYPEVSAAVAGPPELPPATTKSTGAAAPSDPQDVRSQILQMAAAVQEVQDEQSGSGGAGGGATDTKGDDDENKAAKASPGPRVGVYLRYPYPFPSLTVDGVEGALVGSDAATFALARKLDPSARLYLVARPANTPFRASNSFEAPPVFKWTDEEANLSSFREGGHAEYYNKGMYPLAGRVWQLPPSAKERENPDADVTWLNAPQWWEVPDLLWFCEGDLDGLSFDDGQMGHIQAPPMTVAIVFSCARAAAAAAAAAATATASERKARAPAKATALEGAALEAVVRDLSNAASAGPQLKALLALRGVTTVPAAQLQRILSDCATLLGNKEEDRRVLVEEAAYLLSCLAPQHADAVAASVAWPLLVSAATADDAPVTIRWRAWRALTQVAQHSSAARKKLLASGFAQRVAGGLSVRNQDSTVHRCVGDLLRVLCAGGDTEALTLVSLMTLLAHHRDVTVSSVAVAALLDAVTSPAVSSCITTRSRDVNAVTQSLSIISRIMRAHAGPRALANLGGAVAILEVIQHLPDSADVAAHGYSILTAATKLAEQRSLLLKAGAVKALLASVHTHIRHKEACTAIAECLYALCLCSDEDRAGLVPAGALDVATHLLRRFPLEADIRWSVIAFMTELLSKAKVSSSSHRHNGRTERSELYVLVCLMEDANLISMVQNLASCRNDSASRMLTEYFEGRQARAVKSLIAQEDLAAEEAKAGGTASGGTTASGRAHGGAGGSTGSLPSPGLDSRTASLNLNSSGVDFYSSVTRLAENGYGEDAAMAVIASKHIMTDCASLPAMVNMTWGGAGRRWLHAASKMGHIDSIKRCLEAGADVNAKDSRNNTPLILAVRNGHLEAVKLLLATPRIDVNVQDKAQYSALRWSIGNVDIAALLLAAPGINAADEVFIRWAVRAGAAHLVKALLAHNVLTADSFHDNADDGDLLEGVVVANQGNALLCANAARLQCELAAKCSTWDPIFPTRALRGAALATFALTKFAKDATAVEAVLRGVAALAQAGNSNHSYGSDHPTGSEYLLHHGTMHAAVAAVRDTSPPTAAVQHLCDALAHIGGGRIGRLRPQLKGLPQLKATPDEGSGGAATAESKGLLGRLVDYVWSVAGAIAGAGAGSEKKQPSIDDLAATGAVPLLLRIFRTPDAPSQLLLSASKAYRGMSAKSMPCRNQGLADGGPALFVALARAALTNNNFPHLALHLSNLCCIGGANSATALIAAGAHTLAAEVLTKHMDEAACVAESLSTLAQCNSGTRVLAETSKAVLATGALNMVLAAMNRYTADALVQLHGCEALYRMAQADAASKAAIIAGDGVSAAVRAARAVTIVDSGPERAVPLIAVLCTGNAAVQEAAMAAGLADFVKAVLQQNRQVTADTAVAAVGALKAAMEGNAAAIAAAKTAGLRELLESELNVTWRRSYKEDQKATMKEVLALFGPKEETAATKKKGW